MDTVEELNNTYFYAGRSNLTASQLLFMIFCENTASQLGVQDFGAIVSIVAGLNILPRRTKPRDAIEGTSLASLLIVQSGITTVLPEEAIEYGK